MLPRFRSPTRLLRAPLRLLLGGVGGSDFDELLLVLPVLFRAFLLAGGRLFSTPPLILSNERRRFRGRKLFRLPDWPSFGVLFDGSLSLVSDEEEGVDFSRIWISTDLKLSSFESLVSLIMKSSQA